MIHLIRQSNGELSACAGCPICDRNIRRDVWRELAAWAVVLLIGLGLFYLIKSLLLFLRWL